MPRHQVSISAAAKARYDASAEGRDAAAYHGDCERPLGVELRGVGPLLMKQLSTVKHDPFVDWYDTPTGRRFVPGREPDPAKPPKVMTGYALIRCRKCPKCLRYKQRLWTARAISEVRQAVRTWFGTLTVGPDRRLWAMAMASKLVSERRNETLGELSPIDRTRILASVLAPEVTRWLKRVRKESGVPLRYLLVVEPHKDGFPHFHLLLHELGQPVGKRLLEAKWKWGFTKFKLIERGQTKEAAYVCKYLTKHEQTRVRASRAYGELRVKCMTEQLENVTRTLERKTPPVPSSGPLQDSVQSVGQGPQDKRDGER